MDSNHRALRRDPERTFTEPRLLVENDELSASEKLAVLESWQADLIELQKAAEENMGSANVAPGTSAAKLAKVTEAIALMQERVQNEEQADVADNRGADESR